MDAPVELPKLLLTPIEAATALGLGRTKLYELISSGALLSLRIGGARRIPITAIDAFVAELVESAPTVHRSTDMAAGDKATT